MFIQCFTISFGFNCQYLINFLFLFAELSSQYDDNRGRPSSSSGRSIHISNYRQLPRDEAQGLAFPNNRLQTKNEHGEFYTIAHHVRLIGTGEYSVGTLDRRNVFRGIYDNYIPVKVHKVTGAIVRLTPREIQQLSSRIDLPIAPPPGHYH